MDKGFDERKKKYEEKWALDAELRFKAAARRNKLLGRWAAGQMGMAGPAVDEYAKAVVAAAMRGGEGDPALRKIKDDLEAARVQVGEAELGRKLEELTLLAHEQILSGQR